MHYVYMIRCSDDSLYTGYTTDVRRRIEEHNRGDGAKYTRGRTPVEVRYVEIHSEKSCAMSAEYKTKKLSKPSKETIVGTENKVNISFCGKC